ncbi:hypothetical protein ASPZODRAFT_2109457 [Penicilliopsis zonata CBS 506.65]|uniref:Uncharacterized protein n=1 Tax=Penicilliopsis zonata CBS 506.65 TaxID=1073090 RepID=A0A1L9SDL1_9EURO|nr:hypothetical protein ASPZODRAFT_2109457 [Penicilliopsis zonata CBS 506.65]OJJ45228.1 hypothetical protein ASPZODRAFT_2109457 [Penicilliopsis zonata CBS 506.65]
MPFKWEEAHETELLAWLDYKLRERHTPSSKTLLACSDKLYILWRRYGSDKAPKVHIFYETGSSCLTLLDRRREEIAERVGELLKQSSGCLVPPRLEWSSVHDELGELKKQVARLHRAQHESHAQIAFLHNRLRQSDKRRLKLKDQVSALDSIERFSREKGGLRAQLEQQLKRNSSLQDKVERNERLGRFTSLASTDVVRNWGDTQLLVGWEDVQTVPQPVITDDIRALLQRSLGREIDLRELSLQALVRMLTMAAVCAWVFESDILSERFPGSLVLDAYREQIQTRDGDTALRNLDYAAHESLLASPLFLENFIPRHAQEISSRLSRVLSSLFETEVVANREDHTAFAAWGDEEAVCSTFRFEAVMYPPGTPFDGHSMMGQDMEGGEVEGVAGEKIVCCLLPAIYAIPNREGMVNYVTFERREGEEREETLPPWQQTADVAENHLLSFSPQYPVLFNWKMNDSSPVSSLSTLSSMEMSSGLLTSSPPSPLAPRVLPAAGLAPLPALPPPLRDNWIRVYRELHPEEGLELREDARVGGQDTDRHSSARTDAIDKFRGWLGNKASKGKGRANEPTTSVSKTDPSSGTNNKDMTGGEDKSNKNDSVR